METKYINDRDVFFYLSNFSRHERKIFRKYLESDLLGNSNLFARMIEVLERFIYPKVKLVSNEEFWRRLYPGEEFRRPFYNRLIAELQGQKIPEFLAFLKYSNNQQIKNRFVLEEFDVREWDEYQPKLYKKAQNSLENSKTSSAEYFGNKRRLEFFKINLQSRNPKKKPIPIYDEYNRMLDLEFIHNKLRFACRAKIHDLVYGTSHNVLLIQEVVDKIKKNKERFPVSVLAYYHVYHSLQFPNEKMHYKWLSSYIMTNTPMIDRENKKELLEHLVNYCIRKIIQGEKRFRDEAKRVYSYMRENGLLEGGTGSISFSHYINITTIMAQLGEMDWAGSFVSEFGPKLRTHNKERAIEYANGVLQFYLAEFSNCKNIMLKIQYDPRDRQIGLNAKAFHCMSIYEIESRELNPSFSYLRNLLTNFKSFLYATKQVPADSKKSFKRFIKIFVRHISALEKRPDLIEYQLAKVKNDLGQAEEFPMKRWIASKNQQRLNELDKRK